MNNVNGKKKTSFGEKVFRRKDGYVAKATLNDINNFASPPPHCLALHIINANMNIIGNENKTAVVKLQFPVVVEYKILNNNAEKIRK